LGEAEDKLFHPAQVRRDGVSLRGFTQIAAASGAVVQQHQPSPAGRGTEVRVRVREG